MAYTGISRKLVDKYKLKEGDRIVLRTKKETYEGILMPRTELGDDVHLVLKLDNGYNVGIEIDGAEKIEKLAGQRKLGQFKKKKIKPHNSLPINLNARISFGQTFSSKSPNDKHSTGQNFTHWGSPLHKSHLIGVGIAL